MGSAQAARAERNAGTSPHNRIIPSNRRCHPEQREGSQATGTRLAGAPSLRFLDRSAPRNDTREGLRMLKRAPVGALPPARAEPNHGTPASSRLQNAHFDVQPGRRGHVDQGIQAKQVDFSAHQVRNARLSHTE